MRRTGTQPYVAVPAEVPETEPAPELTSDHLTEQAKANDRYAAEKFPILRATRFFKAE